MKTGGAPAASSPKCPQCGYDLSRVPPEKRCPECGTTPDGRVLAGDREEDLIASLRILGVLAVILAAASAIPFPHIVVTLPLGFLLSTFGLVLAAKHHRLRKHAVLWVGLVLNCVSPLVAFMVFNALSRMWSVP